LRVENQKPEPDAPTEWPALEEVLKVAADYQGSMTAGIPGPMPENWARNYFQWRTFEKRFWQPDWQRAMVFRFETEWREGRPAARGAARTYTTGPANSRFGKKNGGGRERGEILQEMAMAKKTGAPTDELQRELAAA
jgi:hypothetical protein